MGDIDLEAELTKSQARVSELHDENQQLREIIKEMESALSEIEYQAKRAQKSSRCID